MDNDRITNKMLKDGSIEYSRESLDCLLSKELIKPYPDRDYDLIKELTQTIITLDDKEVKIDKNKSFENLMINYGKRERARFRIFRSVAAALLVFTLLFTVNMASISAFNIDLFGEIVEFGDDLIRFNFNNTGQKNIELEKSTEDPYGLKAEIDRLGIISMLPTYIPDGYGLKSLETDSIEENSYDYLSLNYSNDEYIINIDITQYNDMISDNIGLPSENGNLERININELDIFILSEDGWYRSIFSKGSVVYGVSTNSDYASLLEILKSFK